MAQDVKITVIDREGVSHEVTAPTDMNMNVMEVISMHELVPEGTIGICGGSAMCGSCQCQVLSDTNLIPIGEEEEFMLSEASGLPQLENSRLSCQLFVNEEMDGLKIQLAPESL